MEALLALDSDPSAEDRRLIPILLEPTDMERLPSRIRDRWGIDLTNAKTRRAEYHRLMSYLNVEKKLPVPKLRAKTGKPSPKSQRHARLGTKSVDDVTHRVIRDGDPRASVRANFSETGRLYELVIEGNFASFSQAQQEAVIEAVNRIVKAEGGVSVLGKRAGSVRLTISLSAEQAQCLNWAIEQGVLAEFGVVGLEPVPPVRADLEKQAFGHSTRAGGMDKLNEGLKTLLDLGKRRGFLTFDQVNDCLPDEATSPERIHGFLETLDEMGIELINEDEAEARLLASGDLDDEPDDDLADDALEDEEPEITPEDLDEISRRVDDPVRMFLAQMGEIPLLTRDQEINLAKRIEITRKRFRRKVLECHFALSLVVDVLKKVNEGEIPF
jgi:Sigma-70 factor, region 1.1/Sigma-70 factor, region 1.2